MQKKRRYKNVCKELFPPISEHDHNYHTGSIKDNSVFSCPKVVKSHFATQKDNIHSCFSKTEILCLQSALFSTSKHIFIKELLSSDATQQIVIKEIVSSYKKKICGMNNRKKGFVSVLMKKQVQIQMVIFKSYNFGTPVTF